MKIAPVSVLLALPLIFCLGNDKPTYWNQFRGPNGDGDAKSANLPLEFSEKQNLTWKLSMPGKAWSSPVVMDKKIWLTNAEPDGFKMWAILIDWQTGKELKKVLVFENKEPQYCHPMNSYGTPTPLICNGKVFVHFGSHGTAALDVASGQKLWEEEI